MTRGGNKGKTFGQQKSKGKKIAPKVAKDGSTILRVKPYAHFGKFTLMPYAKSKQPIFVPKRHKTEKKFLKIENVVDVLDDGGVFAVVVFFG